MNLRSLAWQSFDRTGLSSVCSALTAGRLQILCYHGFSFEDEHLFRGKLFMTPTRFAQRLEWLKRNNFIVLGLDEAIERLRAGRLRQREIAMTIDDGFHSVYALGLPILRSYGISATVYVTSYYVTHPNPIFRLAIQYMAWKSPHRLVEISGLVPDCNGQIGLHGPQTAAVLEAFYESAEKRCTEDERISIAREFGRRSGVDYDALQRSRRLNLMSGPEIKALRDQGFDIQLHTHRHRLPLAAAEIEREITDNRTALAPLAKGPLEHLCYPSGIWDTAQWPALSAMGIRSATTCVAGFNSRSTPALGLRRFLDGEEIPAEDFAAEMLGVKDLIRRARGRRASQLHPEPGKSTLSSD
ncbi:MAG: polysaccharide deacetylase family protein [Terriglobia bacterium]